MHTPCLRYLGDTESLLCVCDVIVSFREGARGGKPPCEDGFPPRMGEGKASQPFELVKTYAESAFESALLGHFSFDIPGGLELELDLYA